MLGLLARSSLLVALAGVKAPGWHGAAESDKLSRSRQRGVTLSRLPAYTAVPRAGVQVAAAVVLPAVQSEPYQQG